MCSGLVCFNIGVVICETCSPIYSQYETKHVGMFKQFCFRLAVVTKAMAYM